MFDATAVVVSHGRLVADCFQSNAKVESTLAGHLRAQRAAATMRDLIIAKASKSSTDWGWQNTVRLQPTGNALQT